MNTCIHIYIYIYTVYIYVYMYILVYCPKVPTNWNCNEALVFSSNPKLDPAQDTRRCARFVQECNYTVQIHSTYCSRMLLYLVSIVCSLFFFALHLLDFSAHHSEPRPKPKPKMSYKAVCDAAPVCKSNRIMPLSNCCLCTVYVVPKDSKGFSMFFHSFPMFPWSRLHCLSDKSVNTKLWSA